MFFFNNNFPPLVRIFLFVLSAILGTTLVLVATSTYGAGLSPDSVGYISAARQISEGNGYVDRYGQDLAVWPPLYPAALSIMDLFFSVDLLVPHPINKAVFRQLCARGRDDDGQANSVCLVEWLRPAARFA